MTDDETQMASTFEAEFRRQMRSGQVRRFVNALPAFEVDRDMSDDLVRLLQQLDEAAEIGQLGSSTERSGRRDN
jgi:hypothetical protein